MDSLTLAATSLIIAISLMITGREDKLQTAFVGLCLAIFVSQTGFILYHYLARDLWKNVGHIGMLAVVPFAFQFFRLLTHNRSMLTRGIVNFAAMASFLGSFLIFIFSGWLQYFYISVLAYVYAALGICYFAIMRYVKKLSPGVEKKRLRYLLFACPIALFLCSADLLQYLGFQFPPIADIVLSALLYFTLLIVAYPQLNELHDFFARALVIGVSTIFGTVVFYFVVGFSKDASLPSFTNVLMASFLIVISITPIKIILEKIYGRFYPESQNVFTSLYVFNRKLEKEKNLMLAEMAPVFAHEIRNPLGSIKGAAQYLKTEAATEEQQKLFDVIIAEVNRLNAVANQFLTYASPYTLKPVLMNINMLIRKAISIIAANERVGNVTIVQELSDDLPEVKIDEQLLMQVILNIALNAIEAMSGEGVLTFQTSRVESGADHLVSIEIRDTGQGINKEIVKNIFKPFFTTKERGVGLGLAICQKIVQNHGGLIQVKSIPGQGASFFIRLNERS